jgi:hypothetical protein
MIRCSPRSRGCQGPRQFVFFNYRTTAASHRLATQLAHEFEQAGLEPGEYLQFIPLAAAR